MVKLDQILKGCRQYNKFAQKLLYEMYAPQMKGLCYRYVNDYETAKDLVQDGFIKVFSKIKQYNGKGSFDGWIKRIFINTTISYLRKQKRENKFVNIDKLNESEIFDDDLHSSKNQSDIELHNKNINATKVDLAILANLSEEELLNALHKIPEKFRTVFNLFCIEHMKHEEIAELLDINIATSRSRLSRARGLIQKELYVFCLEKLKQ